ncbi:Lrp/AsnC family transcriptional regulator [Carnobacteriaceae bacterium zg-ZUI252]|nr:Lrp/AsnC family transcriptional regulator [Carnobacteriaceae bacterium zg-ZUI252]MBS4769775.1 Lrp/AsnC family transcriptional regulator [Carnobacteriaceae bacterium zg-ZUI240]QTU82706.1 Lrp/AsnC family transcriptional regulator [Carnobacteriaceae bacterium zg-C25]
MDKLKVQILSLLEKDGRLTYQEIAVLLGQEESLVKNVIDQLEQDGIICGYQALINWDKTNDSDVSAVIELKVTPHKGSGYDWIAEKIGGYEEVEALYLMSGRYDLLVILRKAPMRAIAKFVNRIAVMDDVVSTATHVVLERYKDHGTVMADAETDQRMVVF